MDWNFIFTISGIIVGALFGFAALFAGIGYFNQGKDQGKLSTTTLLKEQIDALETKVNGQADEIVTLTDEVQKLRTAVEEKNKKIGEMMEILQGRDPQMLAFMDMMNTYINTNTSLWETVKTKTIPTIERLEKYLDKQVY